MLLPTVKWAQRPNVVYLTIDVQDSKDPQVELTNSEDGKHGQLAFRAKKGEDSEYQLDLVLYAGVDKDKSKINITPRSIFMVLEKSEPESWPRLTKEPSKHLTHIKVDWDKWVDSDDEGDDNFEMPGDMMGMGGMGGMGNLAQMMGGGGMPGMGGMGGMPGMGGMGGMPGGMDMASLAQMMGGAGGAEGMGGLGGMNFEDLGGDAPGPGDTAGAEDSDDEDLPELEA